MIILLVWVLSAAISFPAIAWWRLTASGDDDDADDNDDNVGDSDDDHDDDVDNGDDNVDDDGHANFVLFGQWR